VVALPKVEDFTADDGPVQRCRRMDHVTTLPPEVGAHDRPLRRASLRWQIDQNCGTGLQINYLRDDVLVAREAVDLPV
jgi:hypothetical protein